MTAEHDEKGEDSSPNPTARDGDTPERTAPVLNRTVLDQSNLQPANPVEAGDHDADVHHAAMRRAVRAVIARLRDREVHDIPPLATPGGHVAATRATTTRDYIYGRVVPDSRNSAADTFLSVVLLIGDASLALVSDALVALDAQSDPCFELLVVVDASRSSQVDRVEQLLATFTSRLVGRSRVIMADSSTEETSERAVALRAGIAQSRGRYVTVLDATSVVFGYFVATFADLAEESSAGVVRARALRQPMREFTWPDGRVGFEPTGAASSASAPHFSILEHVTAPHSPPGSYALRREYVVDLGSDIDEDEMLLEVALFAGVAETTHDVVVLLRHFA